MNSNYGDSVKFYEKMAELHGQLKSYEEEQYHLQEEFTKLWPNSPRNQEPPLLRVDEGMQGKVVNTTSTIPTPVPFGNRPLPQMNGDGDLNADERRRKRNQAIVDKIKDLEANAAVFAARSERLRIMRTEYEVLVKKYMDNRKVNTNKLTPTSAGATLSTALNQLTADSVKYCTTVGVNTDITGPVKPLEVTSQFNYFEPAQSQLHNGSGPPGSSYIDSSLNNYSKLLMTQAKALQLQRETNANGRFQIDSFPAQTKYQQEIQDYMNVYSSAKPTNTDTNHHIVDSITSGQFRNNNQQDAGKLGSNNFQSHTTAADKDKDINLDTDDSMLDKYLYRHNPYFDMSTTSESDLTSAQNNLHKKKSSVVPININLDDSTQSDTFSTSVQLPLGQNGKASLYAERIMATILTTDGSESTTSHQYQRPSTTKLQLQNRPPCQSESQPVRMTVVTTPKENENIISLRELEAKRADVDLEDLENENNENESEQSLSESLTTSPNDSVMDSVQNRTLNESLPHDNENGQQETLPEFNEPLVNPLRMVPVPSFNLPTKRLGLKEMNQQEDKEEDERKSANERKIMEDSYKSRPEKEKEPAQQDNLRVESRNNTSVTYKRENGGSQLNSLSAPKIEQMSLPTTATTTTDHRDQNTVAKSNVDFFDSTKTMSPFDVLNNFRQIEQEFTRGRPTGDDDDVQFQERNSVSLENTAYAIGANDDTKRERLSSTSISAKASHGQEKPMDKEPSNAQGENAESENKKPGQNQAVQEQEQPASSSSSGVPSALSGTLKQPPKSATGASGTGSGSAGPPRRVKLKLDYEDSDSDASDAVPPPQANKGISSKSSAVFAELKKDNAGEIDDEFDDFFDI